jgi:hypothetical protein
MNPKACTQGLPETAAIHRGLACWPGTRRASMCPFSDDAMQLDMQNLKMII